MVQVLVKILNGIRNTEQTGASRASVEPKNYIVSSWSIFGSDEHIVSSYEGLLLQFQIAAVHLEFIREVIVSLEGRNQICVWGCKGCHYHDGEEKPSTFHW